jgi:nitrogen fixation NifU-like protein
MGPDPAAPALPEVKVSGQGGNPPGQGPFITLHLRVRDGMIQEARYETYPCPGCHACGKAMCELIVGMPLEEAGMVRHQHLAEKVGQLPAHRRHCYGLALLAVTDALSKCRGPQVTKPRE